ncbi:hypothetical protein MG296_00715 [Flavobacteriaceae bacterium TK19130]|nr:hypothetical protein [Thermobacterium salinum]
MHLHLQIIGTLLIALALVHIIFPRYFNWGTELKSLSLINRQMMTVHTFFIAFTVFLMGLLCWVATEDIIETDLGNNIALGLGIFWGIRLFVQLFVYSADLWRGKKRETAVHILFVLLWSYFSSVFLYTAFQQHICNVLIMYRIVE